MIIQDSSQFARVSQMLSTLTSSRTTGLGSHQAAEDTQNSHNRRPDIFTGATESSSNPEDSLSRSRRQSVSGHYYSPQYADLLREEKRLTLEVERLQRQRGDLSRQVDDLEAQIRTSAEELTQIRAAIQASRDFDRPVLYAVSPVGVPTPQAPVPLVQETINITLQHRAAGMHGNLIDVFA